MISAGDAQRLKNIELAAAEVKCCQAGRVAFSHPCPWHGRSDKQYVLVTRDGRWPYRAAVSDWYLMYPVTRSGVRSCVHTPVAHPLFPTTRPHPV